MKALRTDATVDRSNISCASVFAYFPKAMACEVRDTKEVIINNQSPTPRRNLLLHGKTNISAVDTMATIE